jgi:hypothetical protein
MADPIMVQIDDVERPATPAELETIQTVQDFMAAQPSIGG